MARRKGRSKKQPRRDPNAPKKVTSAWYSFVKDHREAFEKSNPSLSYRQMLAKLGEVWKQSDDRVKRPYNKRYESSKAEYDEKMSAYKEERQKKRQSSSSNSSRAKKSTNGQSKNDETNHDDM